MRFLQYKRKENWYIQWKIEVSKWRHKRPLGRCIGCKHYSPSKKVSMWRLFRLIFNNHCEYVDTKKHEFGWIDEFFKTTDPYMTEEAKGIFFDVMRVILVYTLFIPAFIMLALWLVYFYFKGKITAKTVFLCIVQNRRNK